LYNHVDLQWQYQWQGNKLNNIKLLVCRKCNDRPQTQLRAIVLPADPMPVINPRIQDYVTAATNNRSTSGQNTIDPITGIPIPGTNQRITTLNNLPGQPRVTQQTGSARGSLNGQPGTDPNAIMPLYLTTHYDVLVPVLSMVSDGVTGTVINVTCSAVHNLSTNSQISVQATVNNSADGFYSITVTSPVAFTYQVQESVGLNTSVKTSGTVVHTALVGLPYNTDQIPQAGP
jgi:hypothetical protein